MGAEAGDEGHPARPHPRAEEGRLQHPDEELAAAGAAAADADLLAPDRIARARPVRRRRGVARWSRTHVAGRENHAHTLFPLMVFERWASEHSRNQFKPTGTSKWALKPKITKKKGARFTRAPVLTEAATYFRCLLTSLVISNMFTDGLAAEDGLQGGVGVDHPLVLLVLQAVLLDVGPQQQQPT